MSNLLRSAQINNPSVVKFTPDNTMPDVLYYQSFMAKHLGGKIHITNYCFDSEKVPKGIVTYRPTILEHFGSLQKNKNKAKTRSRPQSELLSRSETRIRRPNQPLPENNRRIDYDAFDYDYNDFDSEMPDLLNKCKTRNNRANAGKSLIKNIDTMPKFEHFPMRDILQTSVGGGLERLSNLPTEEECKKLVEFVNSQRAEKEKVFKSLLKVDRSNFGGRLNPNQERIAPKRPNSTPMPSAPLIKTRSTIRPYLSTRKSSASPSNRPFLMSTTTTRKPANKSKTKPNSSSDSAGWNTARPEFNPFQLDPSLLHNGFLFDKRQMQTQLEHKVKRPIVTTARPIFRSSPTQNSYYHQSTTLKPQTSLGQKKTVQSITFKPRLTTSTK